MSEFIEMKWYEYKKDPRNWEHLFQSKFLGFVISRMQGNEWDPNIEQNFRMTFVNKSWMDVKSTTFLRHHCVNQYVTIFNRSSFASTNLYNDLHLEENQITERVSSLQPKQQSIRP